MSQGNGQAPNGADTGPAQGEGQRGKRRSPPRALAGWLRAMLGHKNENVRASLAELLETPEASEAEPASISDSERDLLYNILKLRDLTAADVMVPRVDIMAIPQDATLDTLVQAMMARAHSRLPVYKDTLDNILGIVHIKDVVGFMGSDAAAEFRIDRVLRPTVVVAPSMALPDLLREMRMQRRHMVMVVDEFGGIDGLVTIEDVVEEIVGDIQDEHGDVADEPEMVREPGGAWLVDARYRLDDFEDAFGPLFSDEEHADVDTLGGLVFALVGRVPEAGEVIHHRSGLALEVLEADVRRVRRLRLANLPARRADEAGAAGK